MIIPSSDFNF